jgi:hypothetical protein
MSFIQQAPSNRNKRLSESDSPSSIGAATNTKQTECRVAPISLIYYACFPSWVPGPDRYDIIIVIQQPTGCPESPKTLGKQVVTQRFVTSHKTSYNFICSVLRLTENPVASCWPGLPDCLDLGRGVLPPQINALRTEQDCRKIGESQTYSIPSK